MVGNINGGYTRLDTERGNTLKRLGAIVLTLSIIFIIASRRKHIIDHNLLRTVTHNGYIT